MAEELAYRRYRLTLECPSDGLPAPAREMARLLKALVRRYGFEPIGLPDIEDLGLFDEGGRWLGKGNGGKP